MHVDLPSEYLLKKVYVNDPVCLCVFIKKTIHRFVVIVIYVDDLNIIGTHKKILDVLTYLKEEFKMKDLGKNQILSWFTY